MGNVDRDQYLRLPHLVDEAAIESQQSESQMIFEPHFRSTPPKRFGCVLFMVVAALSTTLCFADALPKKSVWAWIYTGPLFDKWESVSGNATVIVDGATVRAELFHPEHPDLVLFTLNGTIKDGKISVRSVREHSDAGPAVFSGKITTRPVRGFADATGVQTILLHDGYDHQIGLTRTLRR